MDLSQAAINRWGKDQQLLVLCEEMGELMQAVSKMSRSTEYKPQLKENIIEEMADVMIMFKQLKLIYSIDNESLARKIKFKESLLSEKLGLDENN